MGVDQYLSIGKQSLNFQFYYRIFAVKEVVPSGVRVRVFNLPKKKNVHRDLNAAFKGVPGIISINPVVSGSKKTRDPICKGFAFLDFKSEEEATRYVSL